MNRNQWVREDRLLNMVAACVSSPHPRADGAADVFRLWRLMSCRQCRLFATAMGRLLYEMGEISGPGIIQSIKEVEGISQCWLSATSVYQSRVPVVWWWCEPDAETGALKAATVCRHDFPPGAAALRDIVGDPWVPVLTIHDLGMRTRKGRLPESWEVVDEACWQSHGAPALALARAAYENRLPSGHLNPVRLSILADALEDNGCQCRRLLDHLRGLEPCPHESVPCGRCNDTGLISLRGPHWLGCWALDLVLEKS
jgi:hypothetical protein